MESPRRTAPGIGAGDPASTEMATFRSNEADDGGLIRFRFASRLRHVIHDTLHERWVSPCGSFRPPRDARAVWYQSRTASSSTAVTPLYRRTPSPSRFPPQGRNTPPGTCAPRRPRDGFPGWNGAFFPRDTVHPVGFLPELPAPAPRPTSPRCFGSGASVDAAMAPDAATAGTPTPGRRCRRIARVSGSGEHARLGNFRKEGSKSRPPALSAGPYVPLCLRRKRWCVSGDA